jgi:hypothetical protein
LPKQPRYLCLPSFLPHCQFLSSACKQGRERHYGNDG